MDISLIVCTLGRTEELRRLIASLQNSTAAPLEVLIVDQNPAGYLDDILSAGGGLPLKRIPCEPGLSRARNVGLKAARGRIIGCPDDDCWYPPNVIRDVQSAFASRPELGILIGRTADAEGRTSVSPHMEAPAPISRDNVFRAGNSNGLFVRRDVADAVGGFDESLGVGARTPFQSGEETDFVLRGLASGAAGSFDPSLVIHHEQGNPAKARQIHRIRQYSAGFGRVLRKNGFGWGSVARPVARTLARAALCTAKLELAGAAQRLAWAAGVIRGFSARGLDNPVAR